MRMKKYIAGIGALALILVISSSAFAGWWDGIESAQPVTLKELIDSPRAFKGKEVTFICVFHEVSKFYNPYYTRFIPSVYVNFTVWPASSRLWNQDEYMNGFSFCFLERDHKSLEELMHLEKFTRLRLTGYVQNTFKNSPWIEVRHIQVLPGALTKNTLGSIIRGDRAVDEGNWEMAAAHYGSASASGLPTEVVASVEKKYGEALERTGRLQEAGLAYARAVKAAPEDADASAMLEHVMAKIPAFVLPEDLTPAKPVDREEANPPVLVETDPAPAGARPVDPDRYPARPMAMPAPAEEHQSGKDTPAVEPETLPEVAPMPGAEPADRPPETAPDRPGMERPDIERNPEKIDIELQPGNPELQNPERKQVPKKRLSGPV